MTNELPLQPFTVKSALFSDAAASAANPSAAGGAGATPRVSSSGDYSAGLPGSAVAGGVPQGAGLRGPGGSGPRGPQEPPADNGSFELPEGMIGRAIQWTVAIGFLALYAACERYPEAAPLGIVVLIACVMLRLNRRERQIAAAPLVVAGARLALNMSKVLMKLHLAAPATVAAPQAYVRPVFQPADLGITWVPIFFAICLFFMPKRTAVTSKILLIASGVLLLTGLLPGDGYLYIFAMVQMLVFLGIGIGLLVDFLPQNGNAHAREAAWGART